MANKHVLNPCKNSGTKVSEKDMAEAKVDAKGVTKAYCELCWDNVTVNKKTKLYRKHQIPERMLEELRRQVVAARRALEEGTLWASE